MRSEPEPPVILSEPPPADDAVAARITHERIGERTARNQVVARATVQETVGAAPWCAQHVVSRTAIRADGRRNDGVASDDDGPIPVIVS